MVRNRAARADVADEARHSGAYKWALLRIAEATSIPADKRSDLAFMRQAVSLARAYARAALLGKEPPPPPDLKGQQDLFAEGSVSHETSENVSRTN